MPTDWIFGLIGGLMIGSAGALFLLMNGRIMGASGILGSLADGSAPRKQIPENLAFLAALFAVAGLVALFRGGNTHATSNILVLVIAGLLVGMGSRIANGCTSGHGVCGISRFSPRGIGATMVYLGAGVLTVTIFRTILGWI